MKKLLTILMLTISMSLMASGTKLTEPTAPESIVEPVLFEQLTKIDLNMEKSTFDSKELIASTGFVCTGSQFACQMLYLELMGNPGAPLPSGCHKTSDFNSQIYYCQFK